MAHVDEAETPPKDKEQPVSTANFALTFLVAVVLLIFFAVLIVYLNSKVAGDTDLAWQRRVYLFGAVEAIVFTAVGWIFGREVNRQQVESTKKRADEQEGKAEKAQQQEADAKARVADLTARGQAAKAAVLSRQALGPTAEASGTQSKSVYGEKGGRDDELDGLAKFMVSLYPDQ